MAPIRTISVRRSRRLSMQVPVKYDDDGWESSDVAMGPVTPLVDAAATDSPPSLATPDKPSRRVKRPSNAFFQFRSTYWQGNQRDRNNRNVSRICGFLWNAMSAEERRVYQEMALVAKAEHKVNNPHWSYKSASKGNKSTTRRHRNLEEEERCKKIAMILREGVESTVLQTKIEVKKEEPVDAIPSPSTPVAAGEERAPAPDHATSTAKKEEEKEEAFVPTSAIPPLDLNVAATEKDEFAFDNSVQPPTYVRVDAQFGMSPDVSMGANPESAVLPVDGTTRPEVFDPVENYLSDYVNMSEELDAMMTDIVRPETESHTFSVDWAYI
ncbi:hypothetical protein ARMGADRAFT_181311 [Armillaria gallica]|uniref:HMG box domain-containing protein n=1 Tax=Armillaria gallica TaxID=47427 RepID=A0A2H3DAC6_ARMGA|nr:hypothetical protein ARMGADRAFT_181311 [Armillaria gallica]